MSPALNGSSFECSDAIEIRDGIIFDFYTGLPHVFFFLQPYSLRVEGVTHHGIHEVHGSVTTRLVNPQSQSPGHCSTAA